MIKCHHIQLRDQPLLFHNFHWLNIKAALGHYPVIMKEVQLLVQEDIEPSTSGAGFYSNVFVVLSV